MCVEQLTKQQVLPRRGMEDMNTVNDVAVVVVCDLGKDSGCHVHWDAVAGAHAECVYTGAQECACEGNWIKANRVNGVPLRGERFNVRRGWVEQFDIFFDILGSSVHTRFCYGHGAGGVEEFFIAIEVEPA